MKKIYKAMAIIAVFNTIIITHINAVNAISVRNNYGAPILCVNLWNPTNKPINAVDGEQTITQGVTLRLGPIATFQYWKPTILIRKAGMMSTLSAYTDLTPYINTIIDDNDPHNNAIIEIRPGTGFFAPTWDVHIIYQ